MSQDGPVRRFLAVIPLLFAAACSGSADPAVPGSTGTATSSTRPPATATSSRTMPPSSKPRSSSASSGSAGQLSAAEQAFARMTLAERVGQLFMVDCPSTGVSSTTAAAISTYHVGAIILDGTNKSGRSAIASVTTQLRELAPRRVQLFIATDQEGGQVQRLQGPDFSTIP